jgi:hypothetical protein
MTSAMAAEAARQQALLRALRPKPAPADVAALMPWLAPLSSVLPASATPAARAAPAAYREYAFTQRGLAAYRAHAGALAERVLAAAYPTVQQLIGETSFADLARALWQHTPPVDGDLALWGDGLATFIADAPSLADEPYLPDVARLDWAVHAAASAADGMAPGSMPPGLHTLAEADPATLRLELSPGTALVRSPHPVATIWQAHRESHAERFEPVRAALSAGHGEAALVWRDGPAVRVRAIAEPEAAFTAAVGVGASLDQALAEAGASFDFGQWLAEALRDARLAAVTDMPERDRTGVRADIRTDIRTDLRAGSHAQPCTPTSKAPA